MSHVILNDLWSRKRRLAGMFTAVLVGVAFLAGTLVLGDSVRNSFGTLFTEANRDTDAVVRSSHRITAEGVTAQGSIPESLVGAVARVDGVSATAPLVEGQAQLLGADGDRIGGNGPPTTGSNWVTPAGLNPWRIVAGRAPAGAGEVVIDRAAADDGGLHVGSRTSVLLPQRVPVTVVGIATFGTADSMAGTTFTAFTTAEAQHLLLGRPGALTGVLVHGADGVDQSALVARLRASLPPDVTAITGHQLTAEQRDDVESAFVGFFQTVLLVFAGVALLVAAFSIYNAFSIVTAQRGRESALLRALGASRRQVMIAAAMQGLIVGAVAAVVGVAVGIGLAAGLYALMGAVGFGVPDAGLTLMATHLAVAAAVGVAVAVPASLVPAVRASRVRPVAAMQEGTTEATAPSRKRTVAGLVATGAGVALVVAGALGGGFGMVAPGALLTVVGLVLLGPAVARPASALLGTPSTVRARNHRVVGAAQRDAQPALDCRCRDRTDDRDRGGDGVHRPRRVHQGVDRRRRAERLPRRPRDGRTTIRAARGSIPRWWAGSRRCPRCGTRPASGSRTQPSPGAARRSRPPTRPRWGGSSISTSRTVPSPTSVRPASRCHNASPTITGSRWAATCRCSSGTAPGPICASVRSSTEARPSPTWSCPRHCGRPTRNSPRSPACSCRWPTACRSHWAAPQSTGWRVPMLHPTCRIGPSTSRA